MLLLLLGLLGVLEVVTVGVGVVRVRRLLEHLGLRSGRDTRFASCLAELTQPGAGLKAPFCLLCGVGG